MSDETLRYQKLKEVIDIALNLANRPQGFTLNDLASEYGYKRRTAERMRDCIVEAFDGRIDALDGNFGDKLKHWGFVGKTNISNWNTFSNKEISDLKILIKSSNNESIKKELKETVKKLANFKVKPKTTAEDNLEMMLQTEGYAVRQTPSYNVDIDTTTKIRQALNESRKVRCKYNNKMRVLAPLGIIYGDKTYLMARQDGEGDLIKSFAMHKIENLNLTTMEFEKGDFNIKKFAQKAFGVYFGEELSVKLQFDKEIAEEVKQFHFHPTQELSEQPDGSVIVKFRASGEREILWHVFTWGSKVKILSPKKLQKAYIEILERVLEKNKDKKVVKNVKEEKVKKNTTKKSAKISKTTKTTKTVKAKAKSKPKTKTKKVAKK